MSGTFSQSTIRETFSSWLRLLRAANAFTAASNVIAGFTVARHDWRPGSLLLTLVGAGVLFYEAGMVLNDAFDAELDARERPERPIPAGRISRRAALAAGWLLLAGGIVASLVAGWMNESVNPPVVGVCLALAIVMYNGGLKRSGEKVSGTFLEEAMPARDRSSKRFLTPFLAPLAMGWCRFLCALLGASAAGDLSQQWLPWVYAVVVGAQGAWITHVARAETSGTVEQVGAVRNKVTQAIQRFILVDALVATCATGWPVGAAVLALLIPTKWLARTTPMT